MACSAVAVLRALPFRERVRALVQTVGRPGFFLPDMAVQREYVVARVTARSQGTYANRIKPHRSKDRRHRVAAYFDVGKHVVEIQVARDLHRCLRQVAHAEPQTALCGS